MKGKQWIGELVESRR